MKKKGATFIEHSNSIERNFGYERYKLNNTRVDVFSMAYGKGCQKECKDLCGEGIRFTRVVYNGDVKPCFNKTIGKITNDSSDEEMKNIIKSSQDYLKSILSEVHMIDSQHFENG